MVNVGLSKRIAAKVVAATGLGAWDRRRAGPYALAINYHHTPPELASALDAQIGWFARHHRNMDRAALEALLAGRVSGNERPGIMVHLDDGLAAHAEVAAPLLEKHGLTGWFAVVTDELDRASAGAGGRGMTWDHARALRRRGHEIVSHTCGHVRMRAALDDATIAREVSRSRERILEEIGEAPAGFCWPGGESDAYDDRAMARVVKEYDMAFPSFTRPIGPGTPRHALSRANVEPGWSPDVVALSIGRLWEAKHRGRAEAYLRKLRQVGEA